MKLGADPDPFTVQLVRRMGEALAAAPPGSSLAMGATACGIGVFAVPPEGE